MSHQNVSPRSARVVSFKGLGGPPSAYYPNAVIAGRIVGVSRQAINKAIKTRTKVGGYYWMKYYDYVNQPKEEETRQ